MARLRVKNFGPIRESSTGGWIDVEVKKLTVLIGNQGSGKSTLAKLISIFSWVEKDLYRSGGATLRFRRQERVFKKYLEYHRIDSYLKENTEIHYEGDAYEISYVYGKNLQIKRLLSLSYLLPKITYFPAERNFVSSVKKSRGGLSLKLWSQSLQEFKEIFQEAKESFKGSLHLPIGNAEVEYNKLNDVLYIKGSGYKIQLADSASGLQSFVPLYVVAHYVSSLLKSGQEMDELQRDIFKKESAHILNDSSYTEEQKRLLLSNLAAQFNIKRTLNIIEEPEQNLFPASQQSMLNKLLEFNNATCDNRLIITTHSPYIIGYTALAIKANDLYGRTSKSDVIKKISAIVPQKSAISHNDVVIYQLDDSNGSISRLDSYNGIPSSDNYLNRELAEKNELFAQLLDIEDLCR